MSLPLQIPPTPVRYTFTPAAAVSASASVPQGVRAPRGGPGESTIGNVGRPSKRIVRVRSYVVVAPRAKPARQPSTALVATSPTRATQHRSPLTDILFPQASEGG